MRRSVALTRPTTSPGKASSTVERSAPNTDDAYFVANGLPVRAMVIVMPRSKWPLQIRANASRSRCDLSMLACTLNTNALQPASIGRPDAVAVGSRRRRRARARPPRRAGGAHRSRSAPNRRTPASTCRRGTTAGRRRRRPLRAERNRPSPAPSALPSVAAASSKLDQLLGRDAWPPRAVRVKRLNTWRRRSITPRKSSPSPTGHVAGVGSEVDLRLDLVEQLERVAARAGRTC